MEEGCVLTSCLHSGSIPLADVLEAESRLAWIERDAGLPTGTVARALNAQCREYGSCGVMVLDDDQVVGKVRFGPTEVCEDEPFCVQQFPERLLELSQSGFPPAGSLRTRALSILCLQVTAGGAYRGKGIAAELVRQAVAWAGRNGWEEVRANAIRRIPPLLDWTGLFSVDAYEKLGFTRAGVTTHGLLEGVRNMRRGEHGDDVLKRWEPFRHLSDEDAAEVYQVVSRFA